MSENRNRAPTSNNPQQNAKSKENLTLKEREQLLERVGTKKVHLKPFKKAKIQAIVADFSATDLYEDDFIKDLEEGLKKSSIYR